MSDKITVIDDEKPEPPPTVVVVEAEAKPKTEKVVTEKTTIVETHKE